MKAVLLLIGLVLASIHFAEAQQARNVPRIGFLSPYSPSADPARIEAFLQGLRELGYVEGKTIAIEWRWAMGKPELLADLVAELRLKVNVIVAATSPAIQAAKTATNTIPIIMAGVADPVGTRFVPASGDRVETLRVCPSWARISRGSGWNC
jgi:putative tryptophan/tyrosine transport system substrate-binding protein